MQLCNILQQHYDQRLRGSSCIIPCPFPAPAREPCAPAEANERGQLGSTGCTHANEPAGHYKGPPKKAFHFVRMEMERIDGCSGQDVSALWSCKVDEAIEITQTSSRLFFRYYLLRKPSSVLHGHISAETFQGVSATVRPPLKLGLIHNVRGNNCRKAPAEIDYYHSHFCWHTEK